VTILRVAWPDMPEGGSVAALRSCSLL